MGVTEKIKIPDWRIYKIDGIKELEQTRDILAKQGLKWPWLRNEVWRYQNPTTRFQAFTRCVLKGLRPAAALMVLTVFIDKSFGISEKNGHADHH